MTNLHLDNACHAFRTTSTLLLLNSNPADVDVMLPFVSPFESPPISMDFIPTGLLCLDPACMSVMGCWDALSMLNPV